MMRSKPIRPRLPRSLIRKQPTSDRRFFNVIAKPCFLLVKILLL